MDGAISWALLGLSILDVVTGDGSTRLIDGRRAEPPEAIADAVPVASFGRPVPSERPHIDVRLLARTVLPCLPAHDLATIARALRVRETHDEAERLACVLYRLLERVAETQSADLRALLGGLLPPELAELLRRVPRPPRVAPTPRTEPGTPDTRQELPAPSLEEALAPTGPIAAQLPAFEDREGQRQMAIEVARALDGGNTLAIEAGPGTGKTFAYLAPLLLRLRENPHARAVVSTRTRHLQEQLFTKDLPLLLRCLAPHVRIALLKGRDNYLCLRRWQIAVGELVAGLDRELVHELAPVATWLVETETGDIEENTAFVTSPVRDRLWQALRDDGRHCVAQACPFVNDCFSFLARRRAQAAQLVVVNHALLLADARLRHRILGSYEALVIDEAHALEDVARAAFTHTLTRRSLDAFLYEITGGARRRGGWLGRAAPSLAPPIRTEIEEHARAVRTSGERLFRRLEEELPAEVRTRIEQPVDVRPADALHRDAVRRLHDALDAVDEAVDDDELRAEAANLVSEADEYGELLDILLAPPGEDAVPWYERRNGGIALHTSPLTVSRLLGETVLADLDALLLTSATLTPSRDPGYLRDALGLDRAPGELTLSEAPPAFSYEDRMQILVPQHLPPVDGDLDAHAAALARLIERMLQQLSRKTLVLFTSYRLLNAVRDRLHTDADVLAQAPGRGRSQLIAKLRSAKQPAVLLGVDSFWEGVDLPGSDLELLVITRLPFPVPSDPIFAARADRMRSEGGDPFAALSLPRAVLRLRQGVGRLIRTAADRGAVVITDDRLCRRPYGTMFADALPVPLCAVANGPELLTRLDLWFASSGSAALED